MLFNTFSFRFNKIVADIDISEEVVLQLFKLCTKHKICIYTDELIYVCKGIIEPDLSDVKLMLFVEENNPEIPSDYEAELSDEQKIELINSFENQFLSVEDMAA